MFAWFIALDTFMPANAMAILLLLLGAVAARIRCSGLDSSGLGPCFGREGWLVSVRGQRGGSSGGGGSSSRGGGRVEDCELSRHGRHGAREAGIL